MATRPPAAGAATNVRDDVRRRAEDLAGAYPPLLIEAERIAHTVAAGLHGRRRAGPGESFWQHRDYAFGDPVSAIDWRQSARAADRLYVRQNEWEAAAAVWIWRDPSRSLDYASSNAHPTKRRRADILAVALASLLAAGGERIGLASASPRIFHGRNAAARFLDELHVDRFEDAASTPPDFPVSAHARVVFISDFLADADAFAASAARCAALGSSGVMLQIVDPAEETFPFNGRTEFADLETADKLTFGDARGLRARYLAEFAAHRAKLKAACHRLGWTFSVCRTDGSASMALLTLYHALAGQKGRGW